MAIVRSVVFSLLLSLPSAFGSDPPESGTDLRPEGRQCQVTQGPVLPGAEWSDAEPTRFELYRHAAEPK